MRLRRARVEEAGGGVVVGEGESVADCRVYVGGGLVVMREERRRGVWEGMVWGGVRVSLGVRGRGRGGHAGCGCAVVGGAR